MQPIRLAIDVVSGDNGIQVLLKGILQARCIGEPFSAYLCGDAIRIKAALKDLGASLADDHGELIIEHCSDNVTSSDVPSRVWKLKENAPIIRSVILQKEGIVDASISAGDTGVLMGAAIFILGRLPGIQRPALAAFLPTTGKNPVLLLDVGANLNCRVEHLVEFGVMGFSYVKRYLGLKKPTVALLNIGKEPSKGTKTLFDAGEILKTRCDGYCGFVEGHDVLLGKANVVVCDGFAGNVLLKACESFHVLARSVFSHQKEIAEVLTTKMGILNPENYGAVPFLGIRGNVLKAHGGSSERAITNAIMTAISSVKKQALEHKVPSLRKGV